MTYQEIKYKRLIYVQVSIDIEIYLELVRALFRARNRCFKSLRSQSIILVTYQLFRLVVVITKLVYFIYNKLQSVYILQLTYFKFHIFSIRLTYYIMLYNIVYFRTFYNFSILCDYNYDFYRCYNSVIYNKNKNQKIK